jgi:hypothetical protein
MKTIDVINAIDTDQVLKNDVPTVYTQTQPLHTQSYLKPTNTEKKIS